MPFARGVLIYKIVNSIFCYIYLRYLFISMLSYLHLLSIKKPLGIINKVSTNLSKYVQFK